MLDWRDRGRGRGSNDFEGVSSAGTGTRGEVTLPLGPGEWDEAIGIPLCVVCQNVSALVFVSYTSGTDAVLRPKE